MSGPKVVVLDPTGMRKTSGLELAPRPDEIKGKTVGLLDNGRWLTWGTVFHRYEELLKERYGVGEVIYVNQEREGIKKGIDRQGVVEEMAAKCDVVILGLGN